VSRSDWYSLVTAFFFVSLVVNALVTALIVYRIITVYNEIRGLKSDFQHANGRDNINPLISILIESGLITFVAQLAQSIMYKYATDAFTLVGGSVVILYVRASSYRMLIWYFINVILLTT
jgi:hypothetical protein